MPRLRALVLTFQNVYPPTSGGMLRNWQNISILRGLADVGVFAIPSGPDPITDSVPPGLARWAYHPVRARPRPRRSRWLNLRVMRVLRVPRNPRIPWWLRPYGHRWADQFFDQATAEALERLVLEFKPDFALMETPWLHAYLGILARARVPVIYDAHNVEGLLRRDMPATATSGWRARQEIRRNEAIERRVIRSARQIWTCSPHDAALLGSHYRPGTEPIVIPNGVDAAAYVRPESPPSAALGDPDDAAPPTILFAGTFSYRPNVEAAAILIRDLLPAVRVTIPDTRLALVGRSPTQAMLDAVAGTPGLVVTGEVDDVRPYLWASQVAAVPLLHGSGTRLKILEAMAAGIPVVSTSKGAEGIAVRDGEHLLIRDEMGAFATAVASLLSDPVAAERLGAAGRDLVLREYDWGAIQPRIADALSRLR